jgi:hypothetical protein
MTKPHLFIMNHGSIEMIQEEVVCVGPDVQRFVDRYRVVLPGNVRL